MSNKKFLDLTGLNYFWEKAKAYFAQIYSPLVHNHSIGEVTNLNKTLEYLMNGTEDGAVRCVYNVTSTSSAKGIISQMANVSKMYVDGIETAKATSYTFNTTGKHTVDFVLTDKTLISSSMFNRIDLVDIEIPSSVTTIGGGALSFTLLANVKIPNSVTTLGNNAFYNNSHLTNIEIPNSITAIGTSTFANCSNLNNVTIPSTVTTINDNAFTNCSTLNSITSYATTAPTLGNNAFSSVATSGTLYYPKGSDYSTWIAALPSGWTSQQVDTLVGLTNHELNETIHITATERANWNAKQDALTFDSYPAKNSTNPVTSEGIRLAIDEAMSGGSGAIKCIYNITSTSSATDLLESLTGVSAIYIDGLELSPLATSYQFSATGEHTVNIIPSGNSMPGFGACPLTRVEEIPSSITTIGLETFLNCEQLVFINIPESVTSIGDEAFRGCNSLTSIEIPESVTSIGDGTFNQCNNLTSIKILGPITSIGNQILAECTNLISIDIPDSVVSINYNAFSLCLELTSITIPNNVTSIGDSAFSGSNGSPMKITKIIAKPEAAPTLGTNVFNYFAPTGTLYYNAADSGTNKYATWISALPNGWTAVPIEGLDDSTLDDHQVNTTVHITSAERTTWNAKQNALTSGNLVKIDSGTLKLKNNTTEISAIINSSSNTAAADTNIFTAKKVDDVYQKKLTIDTTPTSGHNTQVVSSDGIYQALSTKQDNLTIDNSPTSGNTTHVVSSDGIYQALSGKQDNLSDGNLVKIDSGTLKIKNGTDEISAIIKSSSSTAAADTNLFTAKKVDDTYQKKLTIDTTPKSNSTNPISSGAVYTHTNNSTIHITSAERTAWNAKQNALTFDDVPTQNSTNPVKSGGVYSAISDAIAGVTQISYSVVQSLPATGEVGIIYLVSNTASGGNGYNEYIWVPDGSGSGSFELIGPKDLDLSGYMTYDVYNALNITNSEIDKVVTSE